jgi:hypothetical protein
VDALRGVIMMLMAIDYIRDIPHVCGLRGSSSVAMIGGSAISDFHCVSSCPSINRVAFLAGSFLWR